MEKVKKSFFGLFILGSLITTVILLKSRFNLLSDNLQYVVENLSIAVFGITMLLSVFFNKSRVFFISMILLGVNILLKNVTFEQRLLAQIIEITSFSLPLNIMLFSFIKEKGVFSTWGKIWIGSLIAEVFLVHLSPYFL